MSDKIECKYLEKEKARIARLKIQRAAKKAGMSTKEYRAKM